MHPNKTLKFVLRTGREKASRPLAQPLGDYINKEKKCLSVKFVTEK